MTKTQRDLLQQAAKQMNGFVSVSVCIGGSKGAVGFRAHDAASKLMDAGLLRYVLCDKSQEGRKHYSTILYVITDEGRAALA